MALDGLPTYKLMGFRRLWPMFEQGEQPISAYVENPLTLHFGIRCLKPL